MQEIYVRRLTASQAWRRPVTERRLIMRVNAIINFGRMEHFSFGDYIRWAGTFMAYASAPSRKMVCYTSYVLIQPKVVSDWIMSHCEREISDSPDGEQRVVTFRPSGAQSAMSCMYDLFLDPPQGDKPSERGYEYGMAVISRDPNIDPVAVLRANDGFANFDIKLLEDMTDEIPNFDQKNGETTAE